MGQAADCGGNGCGSELLGPIAIEHLLLTTQQAPVTRESLAVGWLERYERPLPNVRQYDHLLSGVVVL